VYFIFLSDGAPLNVAGPGVAYPLTPPSTGLGQQLFNLAEVRPKYCNNVTADIQTRTTENFRKFCGNTLFVLSKKFHPEDKSLNYRFQLHQTNHQIENVPITSDMDEY